MSALAAEPRPRARARRLTLIAMSLGFAAFILSAGALGDRIGARRVFIAGLRLALVIAAGLAALTALLSTRIVDDRWRTAGRSG